MCLVPRSSREKICTRCKDKKKGCSVKGVVSRLIATGELATVKESMAFKISSKEDVVKLGLERGSELVLLQLLSFQQEVEKRLGAIERALEISDVVMDEEGGSDGDSEKYENWSGCGS